MQSIKKGLFTAALGSLAVVTVFPVSAEIKTARCFMMVEENVYMDGPCEFDFLSGKIGNFFIKN